MGRVVIVGCGVSGWGALRSLRRLPGVEKIAVAASRAEMGWRSRYADQRWLGPDPLSEADGLVRFLLEQAPWWEGAVLMPAGDAQAVALSRHKESLSARYRVAVADFDSLRNFLEKERLYQVAVAAGVPVPRFVCVEPGAGIPALPGEMTFPVWIKPTESHRFARQFGRKGELARSPEELRAVLARYCGCGQTLLIQEIIPGGDDRLERVKVYVDGRGRPIAWVSNRKVRQHPPMFGVMRVGQSTPHNEEAACLARRLLQANPEFRGLASFEFKRDPRDGGLKLIEINVRLTRSIMLATAAGVNYPELMYRDLVTRDSGMEVRGRPGVWWIEVLTDLYYAVRGLDPGQESWRAWMEPYLGRPKVFADWDWRDPLPFFHRLVTLCRQSRSAHSQTGLMRVLRRMRGRWTGVKLPVAAGRTRG